MVLAANQMLFSDCIRQWLTIAKRRVDEVTYQGYELMANAQVLPYFDKNATKLSEVSRLTL